MGRFYGRELLVELFLMEGQHLLGVVVLVLIYLIYYVSCSFMGSLVLDLALLPVSYSYLSLVGWLVGLI